MKLTDEELRHASQPRHVFARKQLLALLEDSPHVCIDPEACGLVERIREVNRQVAGEPATGTRPKGDTPNGR